MLYPPYTSMNMITWDISPINMKCYILLIPLLYPQYNKSRQTSAVNAGVSPCSFHEPSHGKAPQSVFVYQYPLANKQKLVGGFNPSEKYESQWEELSHILWKIKNV